MTLVNGMRAMRIVAHGRQLFQVFCGDFRGTGARFTVHRVPAVGIKHRRGCGRGCSRFGVVACVVAGIEWYVGAVIWVVVVLLSLW